jgi:hypothetical protein
MQQPITKKVSIVYGFQSLIGVPIQDEPISWGNYHSLVIDNKDYRVGNMWYENLVTSRKLFLPDNEVNVRIYSNFLLIDDERIPYEYYYHPIHLSYMETDLDEVKDAYDYWGDPSNEFEQYTNPKSYYEKRGSSYCEKTGIITTQIKVKENNKWNFKGRTKIDTGYFNAPYVPIDAEWNQLPTTKEI